ncbi:hypothetical protein ACFLV7_06470 [Chloroflexota bacterium]
MTKQRNFTPDFKTQIVLQMLTWQKNAAQAAENMGFKIQSIILETRIYGTLYNVV